jgi:phage-related protein
MVGNFMKKDFVIFEGDEYTIEWYFDDRNKSEALDYFEELPADRQKKAFRLFKLLANIGKILNEEKLCCEGDQIYAFKPAPDRFLFFFFSGAKVIITNAYQKKTAKMPSKEKERALKYKNDYIIRCKRGKYYD